MSELSLTFSFDDAPTRDSARLTGEERTESLIRALSRAGVAEAVFYCNARPEGAARLDKYSCAGHALANHTSTHPDLQKVDAKEFCRAVTEGQKFLALYPTAKKWFRYPFLREAHKDPAKNKEVKKFLRAEGYRMGFITLETYDWYLDQLLQEAIKAGRKVNEPGLCDLYCRMLRETVERGADVTAKVLDRQPVHVLLLHENDVNALFLDAFVAEGRARGWKFPPASDAFKDPIAADEWDSAPKCMRRIDTIAAAKKLEAPAQPPWLSEERIRAAFDPLLDAT